MVLFVFLLQLGMKMELLKKIHIKSGVIVDSQAMGI